ncbi:MAG: chemotaxis protein CheW [Gammaproteobacteria bacterium]|nr:chemotaxis protein CheW [Gammaproteobacteria bacterium]
MVKAIEIQSAAVLEVENEDAQKYLTFLTPGKVYAVSIMKVKEIIEYGNVIDVPMMPAFINGAINLRSQVIPVIDLNIRLGGDATEVGRRSCIVVVELNLAGDNKRVGLLVDAVSKVVDFSQSQIDEAPSFNGNINTDYIEGMGKTEDGFIILLNIDNLLSMEDIDQFNRVNSNDDIELPLAGNMEETMDLQSIAKQIAEQQTGNHE